MVLRSFVFSVIVILVTNFSPIIIKAQKYPDAGLWCTFTLEKSLSKKCLVGFDQEFRLRDNLSRLNLFYTNPYVNIKLYKSIKFGLGYRFIQKYNYRDQVFSFRHRLMLDLLYKKKLAAISLDNVIVSFRSRFQAEVRDFNTSIHGHSPEYYWRNKVDIKYKIGNITPYIGTELRYQVYDPRVLDGNYGWHRARTYVGIDYDINKTHSFGIMALLQQEFDIDDPATVYIIGIEYGISL